MRQLALAFLLLCIVWLVGSVLSMLTVYWVFRMITGG
jgi:hypothetical protein